MLGFLAVFALAILVGCSGHKNPAGFVQPEEPAGKLVVTKTKAGGTCEKCDGVRIFRNTAMASATPSVPTGVEGAVNVRLVSAVMRAEDGEKYRVETVSVANDVSPREVFGVVFRNLRLVVSDPVTGFIGYVSGTMASDGEIVFDLPFPIWVDKEGVILDVYANIAPGSAIDSLRYLIAIGTDSDGVLSFLPIRAVGQRSGRIVTTRPLKGLQRTWIVTAGSLETRPKPLPSYALVAGATSQAVLVRFGQYASRAENMARSSFWVNVSSGWSFLRRDFHWYINGARVSERDYVMQYDPATGNVGVIFNDNLIFAEDTETIFELRDDLLVTPETVAQNDGKWELTARLMPGTAYGLTSAVGVAVAGTEPQTRSK